MFYQRTQARNTMTCQAIPAFARAGWAVQEMSTFTVRSVQAGSAGSYPTLGHIFGLCAQMQVFGIRAKAVITTMKDHQAFRDRAIMNLPRKPMRTNQSFPPTSALQTPISAFFRSLESTSPAPTSLRILDHERPIARSEGCETVFAHTFVF